MKIDGDSEVLPIAEAAGLFLNRLNRRIQSFADGVGDPVIKEGHAVAVGRPTGPCPLATVYQAPKHDDKFLCLP